jgi:hypothetical protein
MFVAALNIPLLQPADRHDGAGREGRGWEFEVVAPDVTPAASAPSPRERGLGVRIHHC